MFRGVDGARSSSSRSPSPSSPPPSSGWGLRHPVFGPRSALGVHVATSARWRAWPCWWPSAWPTWPGADGPRRGRGRRRRRRRPAVPAGRQVRQFLLYLAPLPLLAVGLFCFSSLGVGPGRPGATPRSSRTWAATRPVVMMVLDEFPTATLLGDRRQHRRRRSSPTSPGWPSGRRGSATTRPTTPARCRPCPPSCRGHLPTRGRAPLVHRLADNLFTLLGGSYEMAVQETVTQLCPPTCVATTPADGDPADPGRGRGPRGGRSATPPRSCASWSR